MRSDGCLERDIQRHNIQRSWDQNLVACLKPKESNIAQECKRPNPLFSLDLLCGTATESYSHGSFLFSTIVACFKNISVAITVLCWHMVSFPYFYLGGPLLILEDYGLYYATTFVCVNSLEQRSHNSSVVFEKKHSYTQWDWRFLIWCLCQKLPLNCAWKYLCNKTTFCYYFHPISVISAVQIRWNTIPGSFPGFLPWTTLLEGRS